MGTLAYMSPEQWGIGVAIDHRTDIWAVGIMLFRMLVGEAPAGAAAAAPSSSSPRCSTSPCRRLRSRGPGRAAPSWRPSSTAACSSTRTSASRTPAALLARARALPAGPLQRRELQIDESPYAGLSSFQEADADRFFGRTREIAALVNRIRDRPLLAVVGPSGTGKSSFVRAGLVPALKRSGEPWETLVIRPGRSPLAALATIVAPLVSSSTTVERRRAASSSELVRAPARRARLPGQRAAQPRPAREARDPALRRSVRGALHAGARRPTSAWRSPRACRASPTTPPRPSASCCRCARTSSTASPRTSASWRS